MMDLEGAIDTHVHAAPDVRPRKTTALALVQAAREAGFRAVVLKNHDIATTALAATLREVVPGIDIYGGLVLNESCGGLNPAAVEVALKMGAKQIWMPTYCAQHERVYRGESRPGLRVVGDDGALTPQVQEICRLIAEHDAVLGTAHLSPSEIFTLVRFGRDAGIKRFLITHPEIDFLRLSLDFQKELSGPGVYFERCYSREGFSLDGPAWPHLSVQSVRRARSWLRTSGSRPIRIR